MIAHRRAMQQRHDAKLYQAMRQHADSRIQLLHLFPCSVPTLVALHWSRLSRSSDDRYAPGVCRIFAVRLDRLRRVNKRPASKVCGMGQHPAPWPVLTCDADQHAAHLAHLPGKLPHAGRKRMTVRPPLADRQESGPAEQRHLRHTAQADILTVCVGSETATVLPEGNCF